MKKGVAVVLFIFLAGSTLTYAKPKEPAWFKDYRTVYPDTEYIASRGASDTEEAAKADALSQIAMYFKANVNANVSVNIQSVNNNGKMSEQTTLQDDIDVSSQVELFAVEYTEPFYSKKEKKWYCVAYINKAQAWNQYKATLENAKAEFYSLLKNTEAESDPFTKCAAYSKAWKSGKVFLEKLDYARTLSSAKEAAYASDRQTVSELPGLISAEQEKCSVYLYVEGDWGNIITVSLSKTLSKNGFKVAKSEGEANYKAYALVETNATGTDPIAVYPSLDLKITDKSGKSVFASQTKMTQKTLSFTLENAQKKAFPILAKESEKSICEEFGEIFGSN